MHAPINSKAAWRSPEVAASGHWLRHLTEAEIAAVATMLRTVAGKPLLELTRADVPLGAFAAVLEDVTHELEHGIGFKTLRGLPAARLSAEDNRRLCSGPSVPI
jgi:hypothetical protein